MTAMAPAARPASTVVLCRDGAAGVEVCLQRRPRRMGFAGGLWVFPGGRVDDADADPSAAARWTGPPAAAWAARLGLPEARARAFVVAACRETFEEAGVLLAGAQPPAGEATAARRALLAGRRGFVVVLGDLGVHLDTALLRYWAWWVTPAAEPRRYDTRFFVARLPAGAQVTPHAGEVVEQAWVDDAAGAMLPPTRHTLREVLAHDSTAALLAAGDGREVPRVQPVVDGDEVVLPWGERERLPRA